LYRLSPVGSWSRLPARSQMVALFALVSGLLAVVAIASAGRPLRGGSATTSPPLPHGKAHCTQVKNFNPVTGVQIPQYQCTYAALKKQGALLIRLNPAAHRPCPLAHGDCSAFEGGVVAGPPLRGLSAGVVHGERLRHASGSPGGSSWLLLAAGALVAVALLAVGARWLVRWRRLAISDDPLPNEENSAAARKENSAAEEEMALARAADESLVELRIEGDPRRAIIGCYAQMERALARAGMARRPPETPLEYLARVLARVAPGGGRVLTDLYERAMFSAEPMSDRDKDRAIDALEALRHAALT
jgi:Domain of unknown function (DUF4129)